MIDDRYRNFKILIRERILKDTCIYFREFRDFWKFRGLVLKIRWIADLKIMFRANSNNLVAMIKPALLL